MAAAPAPLDNSHMERLVGCVVEAAETLGVGTVCDLLGIATENWGARTDTLTLALQRLEKGQALVTGSVTLARRKHQRPDQQNGPLA